MITLRRAKVFLGLTFACFLTLTGFSQIDPIHRNLIELGYDQPLVGQGPQGIYAYYYYNQPNFINTNMALRVAFAPAYIDSELGFKHLLSPYTDVGLGISGGAYGDNYYEVRQGKFIKQQSFDGSGGAAAVSIYQLLNPGMLIPINVVLRGGVHYTTYSTEDQTAPNFSLPQDGARLFTREGIRIAGKQPLLYPALGMEVSVWFERQWRYNDTAYGFNGDRQVNPAVNLYWAYAEMNYTFTNSGQRVSLAITAGGSMDADRFSAWRLGGVLPLISEFPLTLPGYYYEELTAKDFVHIHAAYDIPLDSQDRWKFRLEAATAAIKYLPGFEQPNTWQTGVGCGLKFTPKNKRFSIVARYGYGIDAQRDSGQGAHSVGLLFQYDFDAPKHSHAD